MEQITMSDVKISELSNELLEHIAHFIDAKSLVLLGQTCKALYKVSNIDSLWQDLCQKDFGVSHNDGWRLTFKQIYTKILHPYPILGFKRLYLRPYGGLVHITWAKSEIKVSRIYPGSDLFQETKIEAAYSLRWRHKLGVLEAKCVHNFKNPTQAVIAKEKNGSNFVISCAKKSCVQFHKRKNRSLGKNDIRIKGSFSDHEGAFQDFHLTEGYNFPLLPVDFWPAPSHFPVTPGLYRAYYGAHGMELIQVRVSQSNQYVLEGLKLTGDVNVPAGSLTIRVFLDKPLVLTEDQQLQDPMDMIKADELRRPQEYLDLFRPERQNNWHQSFVLSGDIENPQDFPPVCLARFLGKATVAYDKFTDPHTSNIHFVVFDQDMCGILWLDLHDFFVMHREKHIPFSPKP